MGVEPNIGGKITPKMDGENNGKPYFLMDDLGVFPYFWKHPYPPNIINPNDPPKN